MRTTFSIITVLLLCGALSAQPGLCPGNGNFVDSGQLIESGGSYDLALGDIDSDGDLDMIVPGRFFEALRVYTNKGDGTYVDSGQSLTGQAGARVSLGDIDSDGDLDMIVARGLTWALVYTNDGNGLFTDSGQTLPGFSDMKLGDLDGDGDLDMVTINQSNFPDRVFTNDGNGKFTWTSELSANNSESLALGDLDGDGDLDVVIGNSGSPNRIYINKGNGTFSNDLLQVGGNDSNTRIALGDIDSDGDVDMVFGNHQTIRSFTNDGSGSFTKSNLVLENTPIGVFALGDINGDGDLDLVVGTSDNQPDLVLQNDGNGVFTDSGQLLGSATTAVIALGDVDGDSDLDIVSAEKVAPQPPGPEPVQPKRVYINVSSADDCNQNGVVDSCDISSGTSSDINVNGIPDECEVQFIRGDGNGDGSVNIADGIFVLLWLFRDGPASPCVDASDINDDGHVNLGDPVYLLVSLFDSSTVPAGPFPDCGVDPTVDELECDSSGVCP